MDDMSTLINIFDLDTVSVPQKPLQLIWWYPDIEFISMGKDCVYKSVGDVKNPSNEIPWGCKGHARINSTYTNDGEKYSVKSEPQIQVLP